MATDSTLRKERTRLAQQKSRAKRKKNIENTRLRNEYLTSAVAELVENSLQVSDAVLDTLRGSQDEALQSKLKLFIEKTLTIAHHALDGDETVEVKAVTSSIQGAGEKSTSIKKHPKERAVSETPEDRRHEPTALKPRKPSRAMPYGLLPSLSGCTTPPADTVDNLDPQDSPFAALLFWNTMAFARVALNQPSSPITRKMFSYAMPFTTAERQRNQISRRLRFRPTGVRLMWSLPASLFLTGEAPEEVDLTREVEGMRKDFESIGQAMLANSDGMEKYLDAAEVERRLRGHWGIEVGEDVAGRMLGTLVGASICIGNRPGWRRDVVDAVAMEIVVGQGMAAVMAGSSY